MSLGSKMPFSSISLTWGRTLSSANWRTVSRKSTSSSVSETRGAGAEAAAFATACDMMAILPDRGRKPLILAFARGRLGRGPVRCLNQWRESQNSGLVHFVFGGVALARRNRVLDVVVLLVLDDERLVVRSHQFYLQLAIGAVLLGVGGLVGDGVLITDRLGHFPENVRQFTHQPRSIAAASGHPGEGVYLVLGLNVVHQRRGNIGIPSSRGVHPMQGGVAGTDGIDGYVGRGLDLFENGVESDLAEGIATAGDHDQFL